MLGFNEFLIEMSISDARSTLGLNGDYDESELKTAFRRASSKNHPDKGGSTDAMQKVNQAYELLKGTVGKKTESDIIAQRMQEWRDISVQVMTDLKKNVDLKAYTKHFETIFGEDFAMVVKKAYPDADEIKRLEGARRPTAPHYVYYDIEWNNPDRTKVFEFGIYVSIVTVYNQMGKGLPSNDATYQMGVSTFAYINGRKVKITKQDFDHTSKKSVFTQPETVFPKKKIDKKKQTKFKKADMLAALNREIKAETSQDFFFIPLKGNDKFLAITRGTMRRQGYWSINGIWERKGKYSWQRIKPDNFGFYSFDETEDTLNIFRKIKGSDPSKIERFLKSEYQKRIN